MPAHELRAVIATFEKIDQSTGRTGFQEQNKLVKVNYIDTFPMKNCDKIVLDVFSTAKVCLNNN